MKFWFTMVMLWPACGFADDLARIEAAAKSLFDRLPEIAFVAQIEGHCGADHLVNPDAVYCTSENRIYLSASGRGREEAGYRVAHLLGHAVQVQHGVAD